MFNISNFNAEINKNGLAVNNLFFVFISLPNTLKHLEQHLPARSLSFLCKTVNIPTFELTTQQVRTSSIGPLESRPTDLNYQTLSTIFMVDGNFGATKFFHRWMQSITNFNDMNGAQSVDSQNKLPYEFEYKNNYVATIDVISYSKNSSDRVYNYKFMNAYPIMIGDISHSWENQAEIMTLPISFTYDKYHVSGAELGKVESGSRGNGVLSYISAVQGMNNALQMIDKPNSLQDAVNLLTTTTKIFNLI